MDLLPIGHADRHESTGECHRNPPVGYMAVCGASIFVDATKHVYAWPRTDDIESCGDHPDFPAYLDSLRAGGTP